MKPLTVVTGIVLGTCLSIALSLGAVLLIFVVLGDEYPRLGYERPALLGSLAIFLSMTVVSGLSFYSLLVHHPARWYAQVALWAGTAATTWYYLPD